LIEREDRLAEARRLTAQLNPHFLLNSLNAILAEKNNPAMVEAITQSLADFLVFSLRQGSGLAPLGTELHALESYLAVEKIRFEERLEYAIAADETARAVAVPTALVLPLLENAIKYGQATSPLPLRLHISARLDPDSLVIEVANSGTWVEKGDLSGAGIGLANLNRRLELFYPGLARLDRLPVSAGEVRLRITLPASSAPLLT
jgi:LytS/YehU family sensor histidine kinase